LYKINKKEIRNGEKRREKKRKKLGDDQTMSKVFIASLFHRVRSLQNTLLNTLRLEQINDKLSCFSVMHLLVKVYATIKYAHQT
jgi:hypothetical protein